MIATTSPSALPSPRRRRPDASLARSLVIRPEHMRCSIPAPSHTPGLADERLPTPPPPTSTRTFSPRLPCSQPLLLLCATGGLLASSRSIEGAEGSTKVVDESERMDLLSLNFRTIELLEEKSLGEEYVSVEELRIVHSEKKSLKTDKRRSRRKDTDDEDRKGQPLDIISLDELAWHDSADDCWVAIYDYVYDCTKFVKSHPGGQDVLLEYAGRDATLAFIGSGHTSGARKVLEKYLIGELPACERIFRTVGGVQIVQQ